MSAPRRAGRLVEVEGVQTMPGYCQAGLRQVIKTVGVTSHLQQSTVAFQLRIDGEIRHAATFQPVQASGRSLQ